MIRKIIHIDMDAFYASIEQRDFPQYRNKPVIVGGKPNSRGVVATCSYEARKYGIHSAMPSSVAYRLCRHATFLPPRFEAYKQVSKKLKNIFKSYTDIIETVSLDEAYLDVSTTKKCLGSATLMAKELKNKILTELNLSASAGVSYNKFLAKIASAYQKPNGLTVITPQQGFNFVKKLKIRKFHGVGKVTEQKMHSYHIYTGLDLYNKPLEFLVEKFGKFGNYLHNVARGVDYRCVQTNSVCKSISKETTFSNDLNSEVEARAILEKLTEQVFQIVTKKQLTAKTLTLKMKYNNFESITRNQTKQAGYLNPEQIMLTLQQLLTKTELGSRRVRLLGVAISNFLNNKI